MQGKCWVVQKKKPTKKIQTTDITVLTTLLRAFGRPSNTIFKPGFNEPLANASWSYIEEGNIHVNTLQNQYIQI